MWTVVLVSVIIGVAVVVFISLQSGSRSDQPGPAQARDPHRTPLKTHALSSYDEADWQNLHHDRDGTPYGAIEDVLMDADRDGDRDAVDGDGMPDW